MRMSSLDRDIFFAVLRTAIWTDDADGRFADLCRLVPDGYHWAELLHAYQEHALLGVVADTIIRLPEAKRPSLVEQNQVLGYVAQLVRQRYTMDLTIADLFSRLEGVGVRPVLLKGEGLAALYPAGCHRSVGDIDVYSGEEQFEAACRLLDEHNGLPEDPSRWHQNNDHHYHTTYRGIEVEVHHCIANEEYEYYGPALNRWCYRTMDTTDLPHVTISGREILLPPVEFDLFFIFEHLAKHLFEEGGGLRQMVDWALYLHHHPMPANSELYRTLRRFDHLRAWQILSGILHHQLGLPESEIPFYDERKARNSQGDVLIDMVEDGNFGRSSRTSTTSEMSRGIRRSICVLTDLIRYYSRKSRLFPRFSLFLFCKYISIATRGFFRRLRTRNR